MKKNEIDRILENLIDKLKDYNEQITINENHLKYLNGLNEDDEVYDKMKLQSYYALHGNPQTGSVGYYKLTSELKTKIVACKLASMHTDWFDDELPNNLYNEQSIEYIASALNIILNNQTGIGLSSFIDAIDGISNDKISIQKDNSIITLRGYNQDTLPYNINISLSNDGIKISNSCELYQRKNGSIVHLVCDIPEEITSEGIFKNETTIFEIPTSSNKKSFFDMLKFTNASSSVERVILKKLSDDDIENLKNGELIKSEIGYISYDKKEESLNIYSETGSTKTSKSYTLQNTNGISKIVYKKDEEISYNLQNQMQD